MAILAVQAIRRMRGGSQSQLMLCSDQNLWVVKFQNNPQHVRILANELIATRLAEAIGLTVPITDVVEVESWLVQDTPQMSYELANGGCGRYVPGLQFGCQLAGGLLPGLMFDYLPQNNLLQVSNLGEFAGVLCLDKWTSNCDGRQAVFTRRSRERTYRATFIDQGFCFGAGDWTFSDAPLRGVYEASKVYSKVTGWESFEPWLSRLEDIQHGVVSAIGQAVPVEWCGGDRGSMEGLLDQLIRRRSKVRQLILDFRKSDRNPFPNWL